MSESLFSVSCLKYGESVISENMVFIGGSKERTVPISFAVYLIQAGERNILVDAGCDTMPGFIMKDFQSPTVVLQTLGLAADAITDVIITHAHHDHIEVTKHFKNAVVHITEQEYLNGKKYIPDKMTVHIFRDEYIINPQIRVLKWGGHSAGSAIVEIKDKDITHVLAGDECYINDCIIRKIPTGTYYNFDKSREFVEKYSDKKYCVHTCHDSTLKTKRIV